MARAFKRKAWKKTTVEWQREGFDGNHRADRPQETEEEFTEVQLFMSLEEAQHVRNGLRHAFHHKQGVHEEYMKVEDEITKVLNN